MYRAIFTTTLLLLATAPGAAEMSIEEAIDQRQTTFKAMKGEVKKLKEAISAKEPADSDAIRTPVEQIIENSRQLIGTFVEGSYEGKTRAKKKIWKNWDDFEQRQNKLIVDAESLLATSDTGNQADLKTAFKNLAKNCKGCHQRYRQIF
jgi:cytochrome c556